MRITTKFIGSSMLIILVAALLSGSSYTISRRTSQQLNNSYARTQANIQAVVELELSLKEQITALNRLAVLANHTEETKRYEQSRQTFLEALGQLESNLSKQNELARFRLGNIQQQSDYLESIAEELSAEQTTDETAQSSAERIENMTRSLRLFEQQITAQSSALLTQVYEEAAMYSQQQTTVHSRLATIEAVSFCSVIVLLIAQFYGLVKPVLRSLTKLQLGAEALGTEALDQSLLNTSQIDLKTKDELQVVADTFNRMSTHLKASYQALEVKVAERTAALHHANQILQQEVHERMQTEEELHRALSQLQDTQFQLLQSEKMTGLSQLVAGVAHEINNPASFIRGNLAPAASYIESLLLVVRRYQTECPNISDDLAEQIEEADIDFIAQDFPSLIRSIETGVERITAIVRSLQIFSHHDESATKAVDVHRGLDSALLILTAQLSATAQRPMITLLKNYGELPQLYCYPAQLNQVFMSLLTNAVEALSTQSVDPAIVIETTTHQNAVRISITDNGVGMSEATQSRIFDPFFTTKAIGEGCGMSLAMSYRIITANHKGQLSCQSQAGKGTTFVIEIPCSLKLSSQPVQVKSLKALI